MRLARLHRQSQWLAGAKQMQLAHHIIQRNRAQALGKRDFVRGGWGGKQISHQFAGLLADHIRALGRREDEGIGGQCRIALKAGELQQRGLAEVVAHFHE